MRALSGGMKRRVLVAQALVHKPPVIVLDEPTAGVDVELRQTLWKFIARLNREGHTVVLTTHYLEEAEAMCQRVAMLKLGKVVALDTMQGLLRRVSGSQLIVQLKGELPFELRHLVSHDEHVNGNGHGNRYSLRINAASEVEGILATLRETGTTVDEMQMQQADLEDIFLQIMVDGKSGGEAQ
jgi:ABC-2 type transport system ATP-binding protein